MARGLPVLLAAFLVSLALPGAAMATSAVSIDANPDGTATFTVQGSAGDDVITIELVGEGQNADLIFNDPGGVTGPTPPCIQESPNRLRCPAFGVTAGDIIAGDGDDDLVVEGEFELPIEAEGGDGADEMEGGNANDEVDGGRGNDRIDADAGNDRINGSRGRDRIDGDEGRDVVFGGSENDLIFGSGDDDRAHGGSGDDRLFGGSGRDGLNGGSGRDRVSGGSGRDRLFGGSGRDRISGGAGRDVCKDGPPPGPEPRSGCP